MYGTSGNFLLVKMWLLIILLEKEREGGPIIMGNVTTSEQPNFPCPVDQDIILSFHRYV